MNRINSNEIRDAVENIGYKIGMVTDTDYENEKVTVLSSGANVTLPVVYNCTSGYSSADAFAIGDDVIVRTYKGEPSHVIGFTGDSWPCVQTPAFTFESAEPYTYESESFRQHPAKFYERYKPLKEYACEVDHTRYINDSSGETNNAFTTFITTWTDDKWHRYSEFYYGSELIYTTYNNETSSKIFNGTRSNVFGRYIDPVTGNGCMIYQINTFTNWQPQSTGRVAFDYYIYTSKGGSTLVSSAYADVNSASVQTYGLVVGETTCSVMKDAYAGSIMKADISIYTGGLFTSDGSTNITGTDEEIKHTYALITEASQANVFSIATAEMPHNSNRIYVKRR